MDNKFKYYLDLDFNGVNKEFNGKTWCCLNCFELIDTTKRTEITLQEAYYPYSGIFMELNTNGKPNGRMKTFQICHECGSILDPYSDTSYKHFTRLTNEQKINVVRKLKLKRICTI